MSSRTPCSQWARHVQICWRLFPSPISQWGSLKIEKHSVTQDHKTCHASVHGDNAWLKRYVTLGRNIMSRLLVLSIPVMNCSRVSLPSRSWSMRRKMSRTRDLLSRSHLLNCEDKTESQINDCKRKLSTHVSSRLLCAILCIKRPLLPPLSQDGVLALSKLP